MVEIHELSLTVVDPKSPVPLYHQIEIDLRNLIHSGALAPDDLLPPEQELSRAYGVGRHTIRMALSRLVADGLVARQAGRGSFISKPADRAKFYLDRSFSRQMTDLGLKAYSKVIRMETGTVDGSAPTPLRDKVGAPYFFLQRLRYGGDTAVGLQSATIITERCPGIEHYDFNALSLYDVLSNEYRLPIDRIQHTINAILADATKADLLGISIGDPLLLVNSSAYLDDDTIIEVSTSCYRADKYEYSTTHSYIR